MAENTEFKVVVGADITDIKAKMAELSKIMGQFSNNTQASSNKIGASFKNLTSSMSSFASTMSATLSAPLILFGASLFKATAEIQSIEASFRVFTGSAATAKNMLQEFKNIAINSPLQFQDITKGAQTLLGYGLTANQVVPITKMLGDISGGNADKFGRLALAFGQVNAAGRLMGQETRQMINAGFNPLQAISEKTGESMASLTKRMKDGKISVNEVAQAFIYATSEGGRFYGSAEEQAKTLGGMWNKVTESLNLALAEIGDSLSKNPQIKQFFTDVTDLITKLKEGFLSISPEWQAFILKFGALLIIAPPAILAIASLAKGLMALRVAFIALTVSTGGWLAIAGVVIYGLMKLAGWLGETASKAKVGAEAFKAFKKAQEDIYASSQKSAFGTLNTQITEVEKKIADLKSLMKQKELFSPKGLIDSKDISLLNSYTKELDNLKKIQNKSLDFSATPTGGEEEKIKKDSKIYERLAEQARLGFTEINKHIRNGYETKLDIFDRYAKEELDRLREYGLSTINVERAQWEERKKVAMMQMGQLSAIVNKNISIPGLKDSFSRMYEAQSQKLQGIMGAMDNSIGKFKDQNPFQPILESTQEQFGFDEARINAQKDNMKRFGAEMYQAQVQVATQLAVGFSEIVGSIMSGDLGISDAFTSLGALFTGAIGGFLVQVGQAAIQAGIVKLVIEGLLSGLSGGALIAVGMAAVAIGTSMQNVSKKANNALNNKSNSSNASAITSSRATSSGISSGNTYRNGSATYGGQAIRLSIDLTGAITASPSGYNINKSLETVLRVTGRE